MGESRFAQIVLHILNDMGGSGQFDAAAIADFHAEADALYACFVGILDQETHRLAPTNDRFEREVSL